MLGASQYNNNMNNPSDRLHNIPSTQLPPEELWRQPQHEDVLLQQQGLSAKELNAALMKEVDSLRTRIAQVESRASLAEKGYMELTNLKESNPQRFLREYKEMAAKRFKASDEEIRDLHELVEHQDAQIRRLTDELDTARQEVLRNANIIDVHGNNSTGELLRKQNADLAKELDQWRRKYSAAQDEMDEIKDKADEARSEVGQLKEKLNSVQSSETSAQLLVSLFQKLTKLVITNHQYDEGNEQDVFSCRLSGRNGLLQFKLTFFKGENGRRSIEYAPDLEESNLNLSFVKLITYGVEFVEEDAHIFFCRLITALNKQKQ